VKCDLCKKNQAQLHLTRVVKGKPYSIHICTECAREKGVANPASGIPLEQIVAGSEEAAPVPAAEKEAHEDITCSGCGMSYQTFRDEGKLGCGQCYDSFEELLLPLLERIQRDTRHTGKVPRRSAAVLKAKSDIQSLRDDLSHAVAREDFEQAARLRDEIRDLETRQRKSKRKSP
jgi:protein arginine kinase activator